MAAMVKFRFAIFGSVKELKESQSSFVRSFVRSSVRPFVRSSGPSLSRALILHQILQDDFRMTS